MATPIRLEAEHFNLEDSLFGLETNGVASGDALISLSGQAIDSRGKVQTILNDLDGTYDVYIGYYDENDGRGQLGVKLGGKTLKYWTLNKDLGDAPENSFYRRKLGSDITISPGQKLELTGLKKDAEDVRIDYIEFIPTGETANQIQPGELSLGESSYSLYEGVIASQQVTVTRTGGSDGAVSATLQLTADSATTEDFQATELTVDFAEGETSKTITLPIVDDAIAEGEESFSLSLVNPTGGATLGSQTQAAVTLKDNDIRLEAEHLNLDQFSVETNEISSGNALISLQGSAIDARGKAQTTLNLNGTYDVFIGYYDESQGQGQMGVKLNGTTLKYWVLNKDLGDTPANSFYRRQLGSDVSILPGQKLEITGLKKDDEDVRIDYLEFIPTGETAATAPPVQAGELAFGASAYSINEDGTATQDVTVIRTGGNDGAVSATIQLEAGTATAADYTAETLTVNFATGETSKVVSLPIVDDDLVEGEESFSITLLNPTGGATIGSQDQADVTIIDSAQPGQLTFSAENYSLNEDGGTANQITILRSEGSDGAVSATIQISAGTATAADYAPEAITVDFAAGETSKTVTLAIINDVLVEGPEQFSISLVNPTGGATIGSQNEAQVAIADDEKPGALAFSSDTYNLREGGTATNQITLVRTGGSDGTVSATVQFNADTASAADYDGDPITVTFAPGETSKTIPLPITNDALVEAAERFSLSLVNPTGRATLGSQSQANVVIQDNDIRLEAEALNLEHFGIETNSQASGNSLISLANSAIDTRGKARADLNLGEGNYDVFIGYYDDNSGRGQLGVKLDGTTLKYWTLNKDLGATLGESFYRRQLGTDLLISPGDRLEISGVKKDAEAIRVDYVEFIATGETGATPPPEPTPTPGTLAFGAASYSLNEDGTTSNQITVIRSGGSDGAVSATVQLSGDSATNADYVSGGISVSFAPGETSKTVTLPIIDDNLVEGDESLNISLVNPSGGATLGSQNQAAVTITDNDVAAPPNPNSETITLEAEALTLSSNYVIEDSPVGGQVASLTGGIENDTGTISTTLDFTGTYDVFLTYYDENDGTARFQTQVGDLALDEAVLDEDLGTNWMFTGNQVRRQVGSGININAGSNFQITGFEDAGEYARLDKIEFVPVAAPPTNQDPIRLEVEEMSLAGYQVESNYLPSNGQLVSLSAGGGTGSAQQQLDFSGTFDIYVGYYDENDGNAELIVNLAGNQLDSWTFDQQLGSNWISTTNGVRRQVASDQAVTAGQLLEVLGQAEADEYARVDYVEFVPVSGGTTPEPEPEPEPEPAPEPEPEAQPGSNNDDAIRIEAEDLTLSSHRIQTNGSSSGGELISFDGGSGSEKGTATTSLDLNGIFDVFIGYYDQNDGAAQMSVTLGGDKLKYWVLNRDQGTPDANSDSLIHRQLASGAVITPGTELEVYGLEKDGDSAAVDYVEFVPVDLSTRPGRLEFSQASYIANENGAANAAVTINRIAGNGGTVTTTLSLIGDTATAGSDFNGDPITVSFAPGEETKTVILPLINDSTPETTEKLNLQLSSPSGGATLGDITQAQFTIVDDEENRSPRLYIGGGKVDEIKAAIQVDGSHHQLAFAAMKARVDQNDWQIYDENLSDGNKNYARSWLAREASMMYQLTDDPAYGQIAYDALRQVYDDPGFNNANLTSDKGLTRAMVALGFAISYDWAAKAWTPEQRDWVRDKLVEGLDSWESFSHPNVEAPFASNWTAVTRGAELVTMLALGEETARSDRYDLVKYELEQHILNGYGQYGYNQEGNGYLGYGGSVLATAVNALRSTGDNDLDAAFESKEFWKLPLYGSVFNAEQDSVQYGVGNVRFNAEGWTSFMFADVPEAQQGYYKYVYDLARGVNNPAADGDKFEDKRAATTWSLIYYPTENVTPVDPDSNPEAFQHLLASDDKGGYFLRNRWQDADDTIVSIIGDFESEPHAWNQPEAFSLGLYAYGDRFIAGPKEETNASAFSTLLVDGKVAKQDHTGQREFHEANATGGYVIIDGGTAYAGLGLDSAKRHLDVEFNPDGSTLLSTLDQVRDDDSHDYTWQINVGESLDDGGISVTLGNEGGLQTFLLTSADGDYVKGWVLEPSNVTLEAGDPLKLTATGSDTNLWVAMLTGQGNAPTATVTGSGLNAVLTVNDNRLYYDAASDRIISEYDTDPGQPPSNNLSDLGNLDGITSLQDDLSTSNSSDRYSFNLAQTSDFSAILEGLSADANLSLFDSAGTLILSSNNGGNQAEQLSQTLAAGSYELLVDAAGSAVTTDYDLIVSATADEAGQNRNLEVSAATYLGGANQDEASAIEISPHNELIVAGNFGTPQGSGQALLGANSSSAGQIVRMSLSGREVLSVTHLGDDINDMDLNRQTGTIATVGDFGVTVLNATADQVLWSQDLGGAKGERVAIANDGTVVTLHNKTVTVWNNDGSIRAEQTLTRSYVNDVAIDPSNGKVYVTGFDNKYNNVDNNPVQVAFINSFDLNLNLGWQTWGYDADILTDDVNGQGQNDMADTRGYRITIGHDGQLYFLGEVAGGNSVFRWNGKDRSTPTQVKYDAYNDPYNSASPHETYYARINPDNGEVDQGQLAFPRYNGAANAFRIEKGSITADENGNIYIGGATFSGIDQRDNNAISGQDVGPYAFRPEGDLTALVVSSDFQQRRLWTPFTDEAGKGQVQGFAVGQGRAAILGTVVEGTTITSGSSAINPTAFNAGTDALSDVYLATWATDTPTGFASVQYGTSDADNLAGGSTADLLVGGLGADTLQGDTQLAGGGSSGGADTFAYNSAAEGADTILDFGGNDTIRISAAGFGLTAGSAVNLASDSQSLGSHGGFVYSGGQLHFDADGAGAQQSSLLATLAGTPSLSASQIEVW